MVEPWDRQPDEPEGAYEAFVVFRDMGSDRTISEAFRHKTGTRGAQQASGRFKSWAKVYKWRDRALAWDNHLTAVQVRGIDRATEDQAEEWTRRKVARLEFDFAQAEKLSTKIDRLIDGLDTPRDLKDAAAVVTAASNLAWVAINTALPDHDANLDLETATEEEIRARIARLEGKAVPRIARTG